MTKLQPTTSTRTHILTAWQSSVGMCLAQVLVFMCFIVHCNSNLVTKCCQRRLRNRRTLVSEEQFHFWWKKEGKGCIISIIDSFALHMGREYVQRLTCSVCLISFECTGGVHLFLFYRLDSRMCWVSPALPGLWRDTDHASVVITENELRQQDPSKENVMMTDPGVSVRHRPTRPEQNPIVCMK